MIGEFPSIRDALRQRGWIEKSLPPRPRRRKLTPVNPSIPIGVDDDDDGMTSNACDDDIMLGACFDELMSNACDDKILGARYEDLASSACDDDDMALMACNDDNDDRPASACDDEVLAACARGNGMKQNLLQAILIDLNFARFKLVSAIEQLE